MRLPRLRKAGQLLAQVMQNKEGFPRPQSSHISAQGSPVGSNPSLDPFLCLLPASNSPAGTRTWVRWSRHVISSTQQTAGL